MKRLPGFLLAVFALFIAAPALATPTLTTFGVNASTAVFDCPWNAAHTACDWSQFQSYDGATTHTATSVSSIAHDQRGTAAASGEISAASYLPTLHAYASSNPNYGGPAGSSIADANIWGVQGYKYVGDTPFLLTITATLDSIFSRPNSDNLGIHSSFSVSLFDAAGYSFGYGDANTELRNAPELCPIFYTAPFGHYCGGMPTVYARSAGRANTLQASGTVTGTIEYLLQPGKEFFVGAALDASVCCGATVDSSHSLNLQFNDATLLVSRTVPGVAPEPGSAYLVAVALFGLLGARRVRRYQR